jgi:hypothetical protein
MIPCNALYTRSPLNRAFVASKLGLDVRVLSDRLHILKTAQGIRSDVAICLDDGEVYDPQTEESLGNLYYV